MGKILHSCVHAAENPSKNVYFLCYVTILHNNNVTYQKIMHLLMTYAIFYPGKFTLSSTIPHIQGYVCDAIKICRRSPPAGAHRRDHLD